MKLRHIFFLPLLASSAFCANITWNTAGPTNTWNTADANWTGDSTVFTAGDAATFSTATGETVTVAAGGVAPSTMTVGTNNGAWTFSGGSISGALTKNGTGALTLSSANSFSSIALNGGNFILGNATALGSGTLTAGTGTSTNTAATAMLVTTSLTGNITIPTSITLPNDTAANTNRGLYMYGTNNGFNTVDLSGKISGGSANTRIYLNNNQGGGYNPQFIFSNNTNDFRATVWINRGGIQISSNEALGNAANTVTFDSNSGADLTFLNAMTYTRATNMTTGTDYDTKTNDVTASGVLSGGGYVNKIGAGTLTLSAANTHTSATTVSAGTLKLGNISALGTTASGTTVNSGGVLDLNGLAIGAEALTLNGTGISSGGALVNSSATAASLAGNVALGSNASIGGSGATTLSGTVSGSFVLSKVGAGDLTLSGASTATGSTVRVATGLLNLTGSMVPAGNLVVAPGASMDVSTLGTPLSIASGAALTAGRTGVAANDITGSFSTGAGTLNILEGTSIGTLTVNGNVTFNGGSINYNLTNNPAGTNDQLAVVGTLDLNAATNINLNLANDALGSGSYLLAQAGTLTGSLANVNVVGLPPSGTSRQTYTLSTTAVSNALTLEVGGDAASLVWTGATNTNWSTNAIDENWNNLTAPDPQDRYFEGDIVKFADISGQPTQTVTLTTDVSPASILVDTTTSGTTYTLTGGGAITGTTGLTKSGSGTLNITGTYHSFTGTVHFNGGTVNVESIDDTTFPNSLGQGANLTFNGGTLAYNTAIEGFCNRSVTLSAGGGTIHIGDSATTLALSGVVSDSGGLTKSGDGTLELVGTNTYEGGSIINGGTLAAYLGISSGVRSPFGTGAITANAGSTLAFEAGATTNAMSIANPINLNSATFDATEANQTFSGAIALTGSNTFNAFTTGKSATLAGTISGTGSLIKDQSGTLVVTGTNTYSGGTTVNGGTLTASLGSTAGERTLFGTGSITANSGTILRFFAASTTNAMSHSNAINLNNATLTSDDAIQTFSGPVSLTGGNTINVVWATKDAVVSGSITGSGSLTKVQPGTLILSGTNDFSGGTTISGGVIQMRNAAALGAGSVTHTGGQVRFSFGNGTTTEVANDFTLNTTGHTNFVVRGTADAAPTAATTVRLTGKISGGAAGQSYDIVDSAASGNHFNVIELRNPNNEFQGTIHMERGTLGFDSDAALGNADNDINHYTENLNGSLRFDADNITLGAGRTITLPGNANSRPINTQAFTGTILGNISGTGILVKQGSGSLIFSGTCSTTSAASVAGGTLEVNGSFTASTAAVTVDAGATLAGTGTISRPVTVTGTIAPGAGVGNLTTGATTINGTYACEVNGTTTDQIIATDLNLGAVSALAVTDTAGVFPRVIATYSGSLTGTFATVTTGYQIDYSTPGQIILKEAGYSTWATANAGGGDPDGDADGDGVSNGVEYFMGETGSSFTTNPAVTDGAVTWPKDDTVTDAAYVVEISTDLQTWNPAATGVEDLGTSVKYTLPLDQQKVFVRLSVTIAP